MLLDGRPLLDNAYDAALYLPRGRLKDQLERAVTNRFNTLLLGSRGAGKTSELAQLAWRLRDSESSVVFVDAGLAETPLAVIELIRDAVGRSPSLPDYWRSAFGNAFQPKTTLSVSSQLVEAVRALDPKDVERPSGDRAMCLIIDGLTSVDVAHTLFGRLRDELWRLPYTWIVSGDIDYESSWLAPPADAFFDVVLRIPKLELPEAIELIKLRNDDPGPNSIVDVDGLVGAWADTPREVIRMFREAQLEDRTVAEVLQDQNKLEDRARQLGPSAEMAYRALRGWGRPVSASDQDFLDYLGWTRSRAVKVLKDLELAGLSRASVESRDGSTGRPRTLYLPVIEVLR